MIQRPVIDQNSFIEEVIGEPDMPGVKRFDLRLHTDSLHSLSHGRQYFDGIDHYALSKIHRGHIKGTNIRFALKNMSNPLFCCFEPCAGCRLDRIFWIYADHATPTGCEVEDHLTARFSYFLRSFLEQSGIFFWVRRSFSRLWVPHMNMHNRRAGIMSCEGFRGNFLRLHWHRRVHLFGVGAPSHRTGNNGWTLHHLLPFSWLLIIVPSVFVKSKEKTFGYNDSSRNSPKTNDVSCRVVYIPVKPLV